MSELTYYEDVVLDEPDVHGSYLVELEEVISFASKWDPQPFHLDEEAAKDSIFKGITACTAHTMAIKSILSHSEEKPLAVLAGLGIEELRLSAPVRPGDTLSVHSMNIGKRLSSSKPDRGIVRRKQSLVNQNGEAVLSQIGNVLVACREKPAG